MLGRSLSTTLTSPVRLEALDITGVGFFVIVTVFTNLTGAPELKDLIVPPFSTLDEALDCEEMGLDSSRNERMKEGWRVVSAINCSVAVVLMVTFFVVFRVDDGNDGGRDDVVRCSNGAEAVYEMPTEGVEWFLEAPCERDEFVLETRTASDELVAVAVRVDPVVDGNTPDGNSTVEDVATVFATVADEFQLPNPSDTAVPCTFEIFDVAIVGKVVDALR